MHINDMAVSWIGVEPEQVLGPMRVVDFLDEAGAANDWNRFSDLIDKGRFGLLELNLVERYWPEAASMVTAG